MNIKFLLPVVFPLGLAGCGSGPRPQTFPPLDYSYLPPIVLKVATLNVVNNYVPMPGQATLIGEDPEPPANALLAMLSHRLVADGTPGTGTVTIETASIDQVGGSLVGSMTVDVNLSNPGGSSTGYTEASVTASQPAPNPTASRNAVEAALYDLTKQLMNSMNVQLQYQIQRNLGSWISWSRTPGGAPLTSGVAPGAGVIQAAPLTAPPGVAAPAPLPGSVPVPPVPQNINPAVPDYLPGAGPAMGPPPGDPPAAGQNMVAPTEP
jgi:hypothetical protein